MRISTICLLTAYVSFTPLMRDYPHVVIGLHPLCD